MPTPSKARAHKKQRTLGKVVSVVGSLPAVVASWWRTLFGERAPQRSFRLFRRRDAVRPLNIPGYIALTTEVWRVFWQQRRVFFGLIIIYTVLYAIFVGLGSQETYSSIVDTLRGYADEVSGGEVSTVLMETLVLFGTVASTGLTESPSSLQQAFIVIISIMLWMAVVWLVRQHLAGKRVLLRDGLYFSGAPLFAMIVIAGIIAVQLIPVALAAIGYGAATATGLLVSGVEAMLFWMAAGLLGILSLYWVLGSVFALVISALPGTYPLWAMHMSNKLVRGRRTALLLRLLWTSLVLVGLWAAILIPVIMIDAGLKQLVGVLEWLPLVPVTLLLLKVSSTVWVCMYVYILYRKMVDSDASQ